MQFGNKLSESLFYQVMSRYIFVTLTSVIWVVLAGFFTVKYKDLLLSYALVGLISLVFTLLVHGGVIMLKQEIHWVLNIVSVFDTFVLLILGSITCYYLKVKLTPIFFIATVSMTLYLISNAGNIGKTRQLGGSIIFYLW